MQTDDVVTNYTTRPKARCTPLSINVQQHNEHFNSNSRSRPISQPGSY